MKVQCLRTNQTYLVDSGASVSIIQKTKNDIEDQQCNLKAANGTQVRTYGSQTIKISLEKNLSFWHTFVKADVEQPIIGADFLANNGLTVNMEKMILTHEKSRIKIKEYRLLGVPNEIAFNNGFPTFKLAFKNKMLPFGKFSFG